MLSEPGKFFSNSYKGFKNALLTLEVRVRHVRRVGEGTGTVQLT